MQIKSSDFETAPPFEDFFHPEIFINKEKGTFAYYETFAAALKNQMIGITFMLIFSKTNCRI